MNKNSILGAVCSLLSLTLFSLAFMSYQNSRMIDTVSSQTTTIGHELLELRDKILNYQTTQSRLHYQITQQIIEIEQEAKELKAQTKNTPWYPISANTKAVKTSIEQFEQSVDAVTNMLDMLVGVQVAKKYAEMSLQSLFTKELKQADGDKLEWRFIDYVNNNLLNENIRHPQIKQFAGQLKVIEKRQTSLQVELLNEHNYEFIEGTEKQLRGLARSELSHALSYCLGAVFSLISLIALQAYLRFIQLRQLNKQMRLASEQALNAAKAKSQFLATMSHELRTPMNGVLGIAQIIDSETNEASTQKNIRIILESGQHLLTVLNDILDFSKIGENKLVLESAPLSLQQIIDPVVSAMTPLVEEKNLQLKLDNQVPNDVQFIGDSARLRQILFNLSGNAIKFTTQGSVILRFKQDNQPQPNLVIQVIDSGIGIAEDKQDSVFNSFEQADASTTRQFGGSGLGLAIVKKLTELMDGTIELQSKLGEGSTFTLTLPLETSKQTPQVSHVATRNTQAIDQPLRILLAEDNRVNAIVAKGFCAKLGHNVEIAENGRIATQMAANKNYDLILMDNHMPVMNGVEATRYLRDTLQLKTLIFAYTADVFREAHDDFIAAGADHVLTKPLQRDSFTDALTSFSHRITPPATTVDIDSNVISLHRAPRANLPLTEEELSKSDLLKDVASEPTIYGELLTSLINDFEHHIDVLIDGFDKQDFKRLGETLHCLKGIAFNLQLTGLATLTERIEDEVRNQQKSDIESMQQLINRLCVNVHQAHRLLDKEKSLADHSNRNAQSR
ncbi:ATP-binding protein [Vibrio rhodolitus]|uniref:ATP-binding protein n=1 Tax=Vibrio rhodolitus TaxID=2231649 RepID=UPI000E0B131D|nr:ATP-binding protein [Vibrio rhodolitus]